MNAIFLPFFFMALTNAWFLDNQTESNGLPSCIVPDTSVGTYAIAVTEQQDGTFEVVFPGFRFTTDDGSHLSAWDGLFLWLPPSIGNVSLSPPMNYGMYY